jgi:hypothetical protein
MFNPSSAWASGMLSRMYHKALACDRFSTHHSVHHAAFVKGGFEQLLKRSAMHASDSLSGVFQQHKVDPTLSLRVFAAL